jgi:hypothetical protein
LINGIKQNQLSQQVAVFQNNEGVVIQFPPEMKNKTPDRQCMVLLCLRQKRRIENINWRLIQVCRKVFSNGNILPGTYTLKLQWEDEAKKILYRKVC